MASGGNSRGMCEKGRKNGVGVRNRRAASSLGGGTTHHAALVALHELHDLAGRFLPQEDVAAVAAAHHELAFWAVKIDAFHCGERNEQPEAVSSRAELSPCHEFASCLAASEFPRLPAWISSVPSHIIAHSLQAPEFVLRVFQRGMRGAELQNRAPSGCLTQPGCSGDGSPKPPKPQPSPSAPHMPMGKGLRRWRGWQGAGRSPRAPALLPAGATPGPAALTRGVVAVSLVSLDVLGPVAVRGVEEIDVLVVVAGQQLCGGRGQRGVSREPVEVAPAPWCHHGAPGTVGPAGQGCTHPSRRGCTRGR